MCKYCEWARESAAGNDPADCNYILEKTIAFGEEGINHVVGIVYESKADQYQLFLDVMTRHGGMIFDESQKINYCPMCGERLGGGKSNGTEKKK